MAAAFDASRVKVSCCLAALVADFFAGDFFAAVFFDEAFFEAFLAGIFPPKVNEAGWKLLSHHSIAIVGKREGLHWTASRYTCQEFI